MSYLLAKYLHLIGVTSFMGGLLSTLVLRLGLSKNQDPHAQLHLLTHVRRIDRTLVFYGGWILLLAGLTASLIPDTNIYHSYWVMAGFTIFMGQATAAGAVIYLSRKQRQSLQSSTSANETFWKRERRCRLLITGNVLFGLIAIYLMVVKFTPSS